MDGVDLGYVVNPTTEAHATDEGQHLLCTVDHSHRRRKHHGGLAFGIGGED